MPFDAPILGGSQMKPPVTIDHPVFAEIAQALQELINRTELLAMNDANFAKILSDAGMLDVDFEDTDEPAEDAEPSPEPETSQRDDTEA